MSSQAHGYLFLFIGAQDDFYDTPKDMFMTFVGVILAMVSVGVTRFASELKKFRLSKVFNSDQAVLLVCVLSDGKMSVDLL
ncbi:MAG: hypothetical protein IPH33_19380 [Bacteroidetes bacterium]|nr:hypothetical protein [Bacteroidota bacterium]